MLRLYYTLECSFSKRVVYSSEKFFFVSGLLCRVKWGFWAITHFSLSSKRLTLCLTNFSLLFTQFIHQKIRVLLPSKVDCMLVKFFLENQLKNLLEKKTVGARCKHNWTKQRFKQKWDVANFSQNTQLIVGARSSVIFHDKERRLHTQQK